MRTRPPSSPAAALHPLLLALSLLTLAAIASPAAAQLSIGPRAATTGFGAELSFPLGGILRGRLAAGTGSYGLEFDSTHVTYEGDAELRSLLAVVDLYPGGGGFRLSGGALLNDNRLEGDAPVRDVLLDNGIAVPPGLDLGTLHAEATGDEVAPYAGLGWDRGPRGRGGWHLSIDAGVAYHGEPDVRLELATPVPIPAALLRELLAEEERDLEEELADYRYLPVVAVSLAYRF
jgi:hypothetical protein